MVMHNFKIISNILLMLGFFTLIRSNSSGGILTAKQCFTQLSSSCELAVDGMANCTTWTGEPIHCDRSTHHCTIRNTQVVLPKLGTAELVCPGNGKIQLLGNIRYMLPKTTPKCETSANSTCLYHISNDNSSCFDCCHSNQQTSSNNCMALESISHHSCHGSRGRCEISAVRKRIRDSCVTSFEDCTVGNVYSRCYATWFEVPYWCDHSKEDTIPPKPVSHSTIVVEHPNNTKQTALLPQSTSEIYILEQSTPDLPDTDDLEAVKIPTIEKEVTSKTPEVVLIGESVMSVKLAVIFIMIPTVLLASVTCILGITLHKYRKRVNDPIDTFLGLQDKADVTSNIYCDVKDMQSTVDLNSADALENLSKV